MGNRPACTSGPLVGHPFLSRARHLSCPSSPKQGARRRSPSGRRLWQPLRPAAPRPRSQVCGLTGVLAGQRPGPIELERVQGEPLTAVPAKVTRRWGVDELAVRELARVNHGGQKRCRRLGEAPAPRRSGGLAVLHLVRAGPLVEVACDLQLASGSRSGIANMVSVGISKWNRPRMLMWLYISLESSRSSLWGMSWPCARSFSMIF